MSRKNITNTEKISPSLIRATFETDKEFMTYEYRGNSAKAFQRGVEPSRLVGHLIEKRKK